MVFLKCKLLTADDVKFEGLNLVFYSRFLITVRQNNKTNAC